MDEDDTPSNVTRLVFPPNQKLKIWDQIERTDPKYTKKMDFSGANLTSINAEYQFKKFSDVFGPCGVGWGWNVERSELIDCGPCYRQWSPLDTPIEEGRIQVHTCNVMLWFILPEDSGKPVEEQLFHRIYATGHTPFRTQSTDKIQLPAERMEDRKTVTMFTGGRVDMEYEKKSVTDAVTKAMSFLGMSADVRMGEFERADYVAGVRDEIAVEAAVDAEATMLEQRADFTEWLDKNTRIMAGAKTLRELELIYKPGFIRVQRQGTAEQVTAFTELKNTVARGIIRAERAHKAQQQEVAAATAVLVPPAEPLLDDAEVKP